MKNKVAINGFGRIGRNAFKIAFERPDIEIVAVNDLTDTKTLAYLLKHDSTYGAYHHDVSFDDQNIIVNGQSIKVLAEKDPAALPWKDMGVDVVIESTGFFVDPDKARAHIKAGAKRVVISAPAKGDSADSAPTVVLGVNDDQLKDVKDVVSNASCTTNCITPVAGVIENAFGVDKLMMTTIHSYTASQHLQDGPGKNLREDRAGAQNITPTTTGASIAAAKALPALKGIFGALEVRVPTPVVSLADFAIVTKRAVTVEEVNEAFKKAAKDPFYQGILDVTEEELVSTDFIGNSHSAIVDLPLTSVVGGNLLKVVAWYDNEWGYSNRLVEITADVARLVSGSPPSAGQTGGMMPSPTSSDNQQSESPRPEPQREGMLEAPKPESFLPSMGEETNRPVHNATEDNAHVEGQPGLSTPPIDSGTPPVFPNTPPAGPDQPHQF
ncbi:MAG TPA: type I glyceraldehyde-3-phosphate dehydrogenase [Candidatus Saccharimonadales bacterium]|nr:type I glyceraldehyde-3-phosphate dehydrogenase [Candidatus Saccharimonadales bacterium]